LEDRRNVGGSSCNSEDGRDQRVQSLMFKMMMIKHGIILRDIVLHIKKIFTLQKKFVRTIVDAKPKHLYTVLFRRVEI
jgi:hypothetical protein